MEPMSAEEYAQKTSTYASTGVNADYTIIPVVRKSTINPGEVVEVEMFLSGHGQVDENKLTVSHSHEDMLDRDSGYYEDEHPGYMQTAIKSYLIEGSDGEFPLLGDDAIQRSPIEPPVTYIGLSRVFFLPHMDYLDASEMTLPILCGEVVNVTETMGRVPPILLKFKTSKEIPPGDHTIDIVFSYRYDSEVRHDQESVTIHVRNRYERNQFVLALVGIYVSAFIVTASLTGSVVTTVILPGLGALLVWLLSRYTGIFSRVFA